MAADVEYTIDELAREAGTTVRSVRVYHERGVLPPPQVRGRTGYYGTDHLRRIRTISRLLDHGIKLHGIRELLDAWERGDNLGDVLGFAEPDATRAHTPPPDTTITAVELEQIYHGVSNGLARVVAVGMYAPADATTYRVVDPQLVQAMEHLAAAGISREAALDDMERLRSDCDRIARRFVDLLRRGATTAQQSERDSAALARDLATAQNASARVTADLVERFTAQYVQQDATLSDIATAV